MLGSSLREVFDDSLPGPPSAWCSTPGVTAVVFRSAEWLGWLADAYALLDAAELARVQRQRRQQERDTRVLAYALHRLVLGSVPSRRDPSLIPLYRDDLGCPRLRDESMATSLSHADGYIAVAVSTMGPVGIDVEPSTRASSMPGIAGAFCHPDDDALAMRPGRTREAALLGLWVRKEAILKACGVGMKCEMNSFPAPANCKLTMPSCQGEQVLIRMIDVDRGCVGAVAGPPDAAFRITLLNPSA